MKTAQWIVGKTIAVLYGGTSSERAVSLRSGAAVVDALRALKCRVLPIDVTGFPRALLTKKIDFAYLALHGPGGEDGTIQGFLETAGIPYSGCGVRSSAVCMHKGMTKRVLASAGIPTAPWREVYAGEKLPCPARFPVVVKPATQGSAIGVSVARARRDLSRAVRTALASDRVALIEDFIAGTEITVGVLGDSALPAVEIVPRNAFYDFDAKYTPGHSQHIIPPRLPRAVLAQCSAIALKTFRALECRAMARVDMIVDQKLRPWILEVNTLPGMTETSLFPEEAKAAGLSFQSLILSVIGHSLGHAQ